MTTLYGTLSALKSTLSITATTWDTDLTAALTSACRAIDEDTGRRFYLDTDATSVRYFTANSQYVIPIDDLAVLTSITVDTTGTGSYSTTWTSGTHFNLSPYNAAADSQPYEAIEIRPQAGVFVPQNGKAIKVTGQFGWPTVPDAISQAATILASRLFKRAREAPFSVFGMGVDGAAVRISRTDPDVASLIAPYNRSRFWL